MVRVRLIHWKAAEAAPLLSSLRAAGYKVDYEERPDYHVAQAIRAELPAAVVIDLSRLPSHGREVAMYLRGSAAVRHIPLVFVNGKPEKVDAIREKLPDAIYTSTDRLQASIREAIARAPANPVVPPQMMDRYQARTAAQKLGVQAGSKVALIDPPRDYAAVIGVLPDGALLSEGACRDCEITLWFVRDPVGYQSALPRMRTRAAGGKLWVLWQKQKAGKPRGVTQQLIRESALAVGMVDYKICSVNHTWSGLLFTWKA
jgi:CheY-like chemotaxis protein